MSPAALIPTPDTLQVPWGWFQLLLLVTLFLHLLLMNVMLGSAAIALVSLVRNGGAPTPLGRDISRQLPLAIAFTVNLGIAPLLFVQVLYGNFLYASSVLMANFWILVIGLLILGYYLAYLLKGRFGAMQYGRVLTTGCTLGALMAIGFLMTNNFTLMQRPTAWLRYFENPTGTLLNLGDLTLFPRYLHFMAAAVAVGGLSIALLNDWRVRRGERSAEAAVHAGCNWFAYATVVNFGFGFWFLGTLPRQVYDPANWSGLAIVILLPAAIILAGLAVIFSLQGRVRPALYSVLPAILAMVLIRELVRVGTLRPYFTLAELKVAPQYSPMLLFLLIFALGLAVIFWLLRLAWRSADSGEAQS